MEKMLNAMPLLMESIAVASVATQETLTLSAVANWVAVQMTNVVQTQRVSMESASHLASAVISPSAKLKTTRPHASVHPDILAIPLLHVNHHRILAFPILVESMPCVSWIAEIPFAIARRD